MSDERDRDRPEETPAAPEGSGTDEAPKADGAGEEAAAESKDGETAPGEPKSGEPASPATAAGEGEPAEPKSGASADVDGGASAEPKSEAPGAGGAAAEAGSGEAGGAAADSEGGDDAAAKAAAEKAAKIAEAKAKAEAAAKAKAEREAAEAAKPPWERMPEAPEAEDAAGDPLAAALTEAFGAAIESATTCGGDLAIRVARERVAEVASALKGEHGYKLLVDLCGVHYPDREEGPFEVVYHVHNLDENRRIRFQTAVPEDDTVPTVTGVWRGADWLEREAYDMYGIRFDGHHDMTRILMWEGFEGHPLRKDFPVEGLDTGAAIYPEYYDESAGPVTGTGTGWKPPAPPEPEPETEAEGETEG